MSSINKILGSIINKQNNFCCLCLEIIQEADVVHITDEVVVNVNGSESMLQMSDILQFILGDRIYQYVTTFDTMCGQCTRSTVSSYKFVQTSQRNVDYLENCLEALTNSFEYTTDDRSCKSLFITLNLEEFTSKQLYDCQEMPSNTKAILKRFVTVENASKMKLFDKIKVEKEHKGRKNNCMDMLLDPKDPNSIKCKECFNSYSNITGLKNHFLRVHAPKKFKCSKCPRSYGSKSFLEAHKNESHCTMVCSECGKTFNNRHSLKMHELGHNLTIVCPDCGRLYKNKATYKTHKELNVCGRTTRANQADAKYTCDYCNKKYTQKVSLRVHIQYEHGNYKAHVCEWCGKKFWAQSRLKAHIVKHTRERKFSCNICGGKFVTKESLLYHTRTHTGERPYECSECNSRFLSASRRSEHFKRHHTGATFECKICHSKFNSASYLQKHKKVHEMEKEEKPSKAEIKVNYNVNEPNSSKNIKVVYGNANTTKAVYKNELYRDGSQLNNDKVYLVCEDTNIHNEYFKDR